MRLCSRNNCPFVALKYVDNRLYSLSVSKLFLNTRHSRVVVVKTLTQNHPQRKAIRMTSSNTPRPNHNETFPTEDGATKQRTSSSQSQAPKTKHHRRQRRKATRPFPPPNPCSLTTSAPTTPQYERINPPSSIPSPKAPLPCVIAPNWLRRIAETEIALSSAETRYNILDDLRRRQLLAKDHTWWGRVYGDEIPRALRGVKMAEEFLALHSVRHEPRREDRS